MILWLYKGKGAIMAAVAAYRDPLQRITAHRINPISPIYPLQPIPRSLSLTAYPLQPIPCSLSLAAYPIDPIYSILSILSKLP